MMFLTDIMEFLFAGAMASLAADFITSRWHTRRRASGLIAVIAIAMSMGALLLSWGGFLGSSTLVQPTASPQASTYFMDGYTLFTTFTILAIGLAVSAFSVQFMTDSRNMGPFYALILILLDSMVGVVSAGDYLTFFLFWEGMSLSAYGLVSFSKGSLSLEASMKYFFLAGIGGLLALLGIGVISSQTGDLSLQGVLALVTSGSPLGSFGLSILVVGLGVEAAVVPLHTWLPEVYSESLVPVAGLVSGAVTGVGVFAILKVVQPIVQPLTIPKAGSTYELQLVLVFFALITMLVGNLTALTQSNLRRILSFSSVAQTGYMLAALSTLTTAGLVAVTFTIWNHGLIKSNFFLLLGKDESAYEESELGNLSGAGKRNGRLGLAYASSSFAMMGSPPFGMFWSEILIVQSLLAMTGGLFFWVAVAVVLNIVLSIGYYFRVINTVVFGGAGDTPTHGRFQVPVSSICLLALSVLTGLVPFVFLNLLK